MACNSVPVEIRFWRREAGAGRGPGSAIPAGVAASLWSPYKDGPVLVSVAEDISADFASDVGDDEKSAIYMPGVAAAEGAVVVPLKEPDATQLRLLERAVEAGWAVEPRTAGPLWRKVED